MGIHKDRWYEKQHQKEIVSLRELMRRISKGQFWVISVRIDKTEPGNGIRLTVFLRERQ